MKALLSVREKNTQAVLADGTLSGIAAGAGMSAVLSTSDASALVHVTRLPNCYSANGISEPQRTALWLLDHCKGRSRSVTVSNHDAWEATFAQRQVPPALL